MSMRAAVTSLNSAKACSAPNSTLNFRVARELLKHKDSYNNSVRPFLQGLNTHTHGVLRYLPNHLMTLCCDDSGKKFLPFEEILRKSVAVSAAPAGSSSASLSSSPALSEAEAARKKFSRPMSGAVTPTRCGTAAAAIEEAAALADPDPQVALGMEALNTLNLLEERLNMTEHKSLLDVPYEFNVGDLVVHKDLRQLGVVAARLPVCLESESWVIENIGSMEDRRMAHPWYLILVAHHAGLPLDFVRYGSQLTHSKMTDSACKPIGFHRLLPLYFRGYDTEKGRYIPRGKLAPSPVVEDTTGAAELATADDVVDDDAEPVKEAEVLAERGTGAQTPTSSASSVSSSSSSSSTAHL